MLLQIGHVGLDPRTMKPAKVRLQDYLQRAEKVGARTEVCTSRRTGGRSSAQLCMLPDLFAVQQRNHLQPDVLARLFGTDCCDEKHIEESIRAEKKCRGERALWSSGARRPLGFDLPALGGAPAPPAGLPAHASLPRNPATMF